MTAPLDDILSFLRPLIEADTQNPPRQIAAEGPLVAAVRDALPGFEVSVRDLGQGSLIIEAARGVSPVLFNVHLDTVPAAPGWSTDPHALTIAEDRAFGLGTCDTKGAGAVLFALAKHTDHPMRLLLTTDEEAGQSICIRTFLEEDPGAGLAVVAEPTEALARFEHRGLVSARSHFTGESAHASEKARPSAVHDAARFITAALAQDFAEDNRLNFGRIEGGVKPNMVAAECEVLFGFRAHPGADHVRILDELRDLAPGAVVKERFVGPALPSDKSGRAAEAQVRARRTAEAIGLPMGEPVDFWTEASLFAAAGIPSMVLGAGSITQAHNADEFVTYDQLTSLYELYQKVLAHHG